MRFLIDKKLYKENMTMAEMYLAIKNYSKIKDIEEAIILAENIWDEYGQFSPSKAKEYVKYDNTLTESQKTNRTSELEFIEYEIKNCRVIKGNPHHKLEESFELFLKNTLDAQNIEKDKAFIDFQFELNDEKYICELKPSDGEKEKKYAIQSAVGQILRYAFNKEYDYKIIVFQGAPSGDNLQFLDYLRTEHNIYYLYEEVKSVFKGNIF